VFAALTSTKFLILQILAWIRGYPKWKKPSSLKFFLSRQPGYLEQAKTRSFPSPPHDGFGFF
jgi:hypothetical protein